MPRKSLRERLRKLTQPIMAQVAPGKWAPADPQLTPPDLTLAKWMPNGDGTYSPLPATENFVRVNAQLVRKLGFHGQWNTLRRLARAGFIEIIQIAPFTSLMNLDSYYNHLRRCAEDPEFWDASKGNGQEYRKAL